MPDFTSLCLKWFKGFFHKWVLYFLLVVLVISLYSVHRGAVEHKRVSADSEEFQKREAAIFSNIMSYDEYSNTGIAVMFLPGASSLFFSNPPIMFQLSAGINSIAKLDINGSGGGFRIGGNSQFRFRFSRVVQVLLSILALYTVFTAMRSREYLKFLSSGCSRITVLSSIITTGFLSIALSFLFILGCGLAVVLLHGIPLHRLDIAGLCRYAAVTFLMILFFAAAGALCGTFLKKAAAYTLLPLVWFTFVFLVPNIIDSIYEERSAAVISANKLYNDKLKVINDFEKRIEGKYGKFDKDNIEIEREIIEYYWKEVFPKVEALDRRRRDEVAELVKEYNFFSMFTVTTFYNRTAEEIGGRGYGGYLSFYDNVLKLRRGFVRHWIDRVYYHNPKELVSFVRENENLFHGDSRVPDYFALGFLFNLCIVLALVPVLSWRFNKYLDALEDDAPFKKDNPAVVLNKGEAKVLKLFRRGGIVEGFYNLLSGRASSNKTSNPLRLKVDNVDFSVARGKANFLYVCHPDRIPGWLRVKDFISFVRRLPGLSGEQEQAIHAAPGPDLIQGKTFGQLEREQRGKVLLAVLPNFRHGIYLVGNMGTDTGMSSSFIFKLSDIMKQWSDSGSSVLYFTTEREVKVEFPGNQKDRDFLEIEMWLEKVNHLKGLSEEK